MQNNPNLNHLKKKSDIELMELLERGEEEELSLLHPEDVAALEDAKLAMAALGSWEQDEPIQASEQFWPKLREQLPAQPPRSAWQRTWSMASDWFWPAHAPLAASMRVALVAIIIALASFWFAPQRAITPLSAESFTAEETAFIERSLQKHDNYVTMESGDGSLGISAGDATSTELPNDEPVVEYIP